MEIPTAPRTSAAPTSGSGNQPPWHGIPRNEIPWYPTVDADTCIHCGLCYLTCGRMVYEMPDDNAVAIVAEPFKCMVGCSTCGTICPSGAISFPDPSLVQKIEREHKVLKVIREEVKTKKAKVELERARSKAAQAISSIVTQVEFEVAGDFGEKRFMMQLYEYVKDRDCDVTHFVLENPTLKGTLGGKAPAYCKFRLVSETYDAIEHHVAELHKLIERNQLVLTNERKV